MALRATPRLSERDTVAALALVLLVSNGYSQKQAVSILRANGLAIDPPKATELLKAARERGWIRHHSIFDCAPADLAHHDPNQSLLQRARTAASDHSDLESRLRGLYPARFRSLHVCFSGHDGTSKEQWVERLRYFARSAARIVPAILRRSSVVGVGWGHTVAELVNAATGPAFRRSFRRNLLFVPTCGEPLKPSGPEHWPERASSRLAAILTEAFSTQQRLLSLAGVVAVEPEAFRSAEGRQFLRRYFGVISDYPSIFGPCEGDATPLIGQMDAIVTSVGSFAQDWRLYTSELDRAGGTPREELTRLFAGDIGGAMIPLDTLSTSDRNVARKIASAWTGIDVNQYMAVASRAAGSGSAGVCVAAVGANKAEIVREAVRRGLVNELIVDHDLAHALHRRL